LSLIRLNLGREPKSVMAFGEVLWDQLPTGPMLGGAAANFACLVQGLGVDCTLVSRVGDDPLGQKARQALAHLHLSSSHVQTDPRAPTGTVAVHFDGGGHPDYTIAPHVAYDHIEVTPALLEQASQAAMLYFGTLAQRHRTSRDTLWQLIEAAPQAIKLLDINLRRDCYTAKTVTAALSRCDMLKLNESEAQELNLLLRLGASTPEEFSEAVIERFNLDLCLVTCGPDGVFAQTNTGQMQRVPGYPVTVHDTIGAGDAFTAGFVWSHLQGVSLRESCEVGVRCGALVAMQQGGMVTLRPEQITCFPFASWLVPS
jgi:fructokinase